jgi:hypothetical protein
MWLLVNNVLKTCECAVLTTILSVYVATLTKNVIPEQRHNVWNCFKIAVVLLFNVVGNHHSDNVLTVLHNDCRLTTFSKRTTQTLLKRFRPSTLRRYLKTSYPNNVTTFEIVFKLLKFCCSLTLASIIFVPL